MPIAEIARVALSQLPQVPDAIADAVQTDVVGGLLG